MDAVTKSVKEMYEKYPFPACNMINVAYGKRIRNDLKNRDLSCNGFKILDAGCGSGEKVISLAKVFPDSEVIGWDISGASLGKARALAEQEKVSNIKFENVNLLDFDLEQYKDNFDLIISWGVIHHLADTVKGFRNLGICLKPTGLLYAWLYALHSLQRIETRLVREAADVLLQKEEFSYEKGVKVVNAVKKLIKTLNYGGKRDFFMHLKWFFDKDVDKRQILAHVFKHAGKLKYGSDYDANIVDAFLHANVKDYSIRMIFEETEAAGLEIVDFIEPPVKIEPFVDSDYVIKLYNNLSFRDKMEVMERLVNPGNHLFLARRK